MYPDVRGHPKVFSVAEHRKRLVAKGRECREATKKSDESEGTELRPEQLPGLSESGDHSDSAAAHEVDCHGSVREGRERDLPVNETAETVSRQSTDEASRTDHCRVDQCRLQACLHYCTAVRLTAWLTGAQCLVRGLQMQAA